MSNMDYYFMLFYGTTYDNYYCIIIIIVTTILAIGTLLVGHLDDELHTGTLYYAIFLLNYHPIY